MTMPNGPMTTTEHVFSLVSQRQAFKLCAELVERSFAFVLDRGGLHRAWLHGQGNLQKRYMIHISGYNLGLLMRLLTGFGTPRSLADAKIGIIWMRYPINSHDVVVFCCLVVIHGPSQASVIQRETVLLIC